MDDKRTGYIAPFYFCIPENTVKEYPNVSGEPTPSRGKRRFQKVQPGPVYPQQQTSSQQARAYVSDSQGPSAHWFAYLWAFAAFGVIAVFLLTFADESAGDGEFESALIAGGLVGSLVAWAIMRKSSKLGWLVVVAASVLAVFLLVTVE